MNQVLLCVVLAIAAVRPGLAMLPSDECGDHVPASEVLHERWTKMMSDHCVQHGLGLENVCTYRQIHQSIGLVGQKTICEETPCPQDDPDCEKSTCNRHGSVSCTPDQSHPDLAHRSLCPYVYHETYNCRRYPPTLLEAKCRCSHCKIPSAAVLSSTTMCKEIHYNIPVLRDTGRREPNGTAVYEPGYHPLAVACACTAIPASTVD